MRVLATNCSLRGRSGTEMVTIDLALGLSRRGHEVAVFAPLVGRSAEILRDEGIVVTDRPPDLAWNPDIIHGHHNHVLAAALAFFPEVPALFVCHSSNYWFDGPPLLPRVRRFCSVDEACRARLIAEVGCEKEAIELLPNAVDLDLFSPRGRLPAKPRRALLLTKNTEHISAVRAAVREAGLELDEIGSVFNREVNDLHDRLKQYDLVFATARMALEALAVGCAVVVVDGRGLAGLVTSSTVDDWRLNNFGLRLLIHGPTKETILSEIGRYDPHDAALVSHRIRDVASLATHLDRVEAIHRDIVDEPRNPPDPTRDLRALGSFVAQWLRRLGEGMIPENFDTLLAANKFVAEHCAIVEDNGSLRQQLECSHSRVDSLENENAMLRQTLRSPLHVMRLYAGAIRRSLFGREQ
ncbi:MAG TPA: glycosyltransferase [Pyrinomonadaceae bacterium]|nr:glycosyltransferase [Pyrinomonadaceae bacterium]